jgi:hypothetical protein
MSNPVTLFKNNFWALVFTFINSFSPNIYSTLERHHKLSAMADQGPSKAEINAIFKRLKSIPANKVFSVCFIQ